MLTILITLLFFKGSSPTPIESFELFPEATHIEIQVQPLLAGKAYLIGSMGEQNYRLDSATINPAGKMVFQRNEAYPAGLVYVQLPDRTYFPFLIDQDQSFSLSTKAGDLIAAMQVEGSLDNQLFYQSLQFEMKLEPRFQEVAQQLKNQTPGTSAYQELKTRQNQLIAERNTFLQSIFKQYSGSFFTTFKKAGQNPELTEVYRPDGSPDTEKQVYLYRSQFWNGVDFNNEALLRTPVIINKLKRYITELTPQNPDSIKKATAALIDQVLDKPAYFQFFANWIALHYEPSKTTLMDSEAVYVFMVQHYFTHPRAFWADSMQIVRLQLRAQEMASSLVGGKAPNVSANDPNGQLQSIAAIKSPYLIVYLYNPSCDHCIAETPKLVQFYQDWKAKGVEVYAIAIDTNAEEWKSFIAKNGMTWTNVFDPTNRAIYAKYYVDNTPEIYVLNPERIIIGKNLKVNQIEEVIRKDQKIR